MVKKSKFYLTAAMVFVCGIMVLSRVSRAEAATVVDQQSITVNALVPGPVPTQPAIINSPTNNQVFSTTPLNVQGTGTPGTVVKLFINSVLAGVSTVADDGTFSINVTLNQGRNDLAVFLYNLADQVGPNSLIVTVYVRGATTTTGLSDGSALDAPPVAPMKRAGGGGAGDSSNSSGSNVDNTDQWIFENTPLENIAYVLGVGVGSENISGIRLLLWWPVLAGFGMLVLLWLFLFRLHRVGLLTKYVKTLGFYPELDNSDHDRKNQHHK